MREGDGGHFLQTSQRWPCQAQRPVKRADVNRIPTQFTMLHENNVERTKSLE